VAVTGTDGGCKRVWVLLASSNLSKNAPLVATRLLLDNEPAITAWRANIPRLGSGVDEDPVVLSSRGLLGNWTREGTSVGAGGGGTAGFDKTNCMHATHSSGVSRNCFHSSSASIASCILNVAVSRYDFQLAFWAKLSYSRLLLKYKDISAVAETLRSFEYLRSFDTVSVSERMCLNAAPISTKLSTARVLGWLSMKVLRVAAMRGISRVVYGSMIAARSITSGIQQLESKLSRGSTAAMLRQRDSASQSSSAFRVAGQHWRRIFAAPQNHAATRVRAEAAAISAGEGTERSFGVNLLMSCSRQFLTIASGESFRFVGHGSFTLVPDVCMRGAFSAAGGAALLGLDLLDARHSSCAGLLLLADGNANTARAAGRLTGNDANTGGTPELLGPLDDDAADDTGDDCPEGPALAGGGEATELEPPPCATEVTGGVLGTWGTVATGTGGDWGGPVGASTAGLPITALLIQDTSCALTPRLNLRLRRVHKRPRP